MQKRRLGQTDIEVSVLGLGTVKLGRNEGVKYAHHFLLPTDAEISYLLASAQTLGINLLDTAPAYGLSEERLGKALKGKRSEWIISTKAGEEFQQGKSFFDFSESAIQKSVERSLKRLQTDYLDIVLIHSNGEDERLIEKDQVFATLANLKSQGKIRAYGMSSKTVAGGLAAIKKSDLAMVALNPTYTDEREVISLAKTLQKGIFIKKALNSGHLAPKEALSFAVNEAGVTSIIIGTLSSTHLRENAQFIE